MSSRRKLAAEIQQQVRTRANFLCEYCHASEQWQYVPFTIDHLLPVVQGGTDELDNLALACFHCNRRKTNQTSAIDPQTEQLVSLFNPRHDLWSNHFIWSADGLIIISLTAIGRATVAALTLNRARVINIREADKTIGRHPPSTDPIQT
ncbi:HNH endonuclease [Cyanobacteria bacterium FACHB-63]|nr:HNH endonuclease [Cyanobacteria bacterium FACHB-63]